MRHSIQSTHSLRWTLVYLLSFAAPMFQFGFCNVQATGVETFGYTITATGTENITNAPPQRFNYTVTGSGTETWNETVSTNKNLHLAVSSGRVLSVTRLFSFTPEFQDQARGGLDESSGEKTPIAMEALEAKTKVDSKAVLVPNR